MTFDLPEEIHPLQWYEKVHVLKLVLLFIPEAYHLRREETDWFDKPRDGRSENGQEKRQVKRVCV